MKVDVWSLERLFAKACRCLGWYGKKNDRGGARPTYIEEGVQLNERERYIWMAELCRRISG